MKNLWNTKKAKSFINSGSLVKKLSGKIVSYAFVIELVELNGIDLLDTNPIFSIVKY